MYYFAYGSNMNLKQMERRCPSAKFSKRAYLQGYRFVYDGYSAVRNGPVANIVEDKDSIVWGVLFEIDEDCRNRLDSYEGYPDCYDRKVIKVKDDEGMEYEALVYLRKPRPEGEPSKVYRNIVLEGARECGLPEDYIMESIAK
ncbi:MAG: gamma-glutamylcyclotransferase family protein [Hydrogenothermaceae bacterium]